MSFLAARRRPSTAVPCASLALFLLAAGCVERRDLSAAEKEEIARLVSTEAPNPPHAVRADLEGKITLLGYALSSEALVKGKAGKITFFWKVNEALEGSWRLFTHVGDGRTPEMRLNLDGDGPIRRLHPPSRWKAGQYIRDEQRITIPADWPTNEAVFYVGLWNGPHRLEVIDGPSDGDDRVRVASVRVIEPASEGDVPRLPVPRVLAPKAAEPLVIDGRLDESAWSNAAETGAFINTLDGSDASFPASARLLWDDEHLYVAFEVKDELVKNPIEGEADDPEAEAARDEHLWEGDVVELMIDPDGDGRNYFEVQVSPTGRVFDTRYDRRRHPAPFGHLDWSSNVQARVRIDGTPNDDDADDGYLVELAIPWSAFEAGDRPATKPTVGDEWRINLYVMNAVARGQQGAGWSATRVADFHVPMRFARVIFADTDGNAPNAEPPRAARPPQPAPGLLKLPPGIQVVEEDSAADLLRKQENNNKPAGKEKIPTKVQVLP